MREFFPELARALPRIPFFVCFLLRKMSNQIYSLPFYKLCPSACVGWKVGLTEVDKFTSCVVLTHISKSRLLYAWSLLSRRFCKADADNSYMKQVVPVYGHVFRVNNQVDPRGGNTS
jgi:hypothetical protein